VKICVLGGTGFVGTELIARLTDAGHFVRVPTRVLANGSHLLVLPTVEVMAANIHDLRVLGRLFESMDVVINLVGILNESGRRGAGFRAAHADLATKVVEAARAARVKRLLHMSSLGADPAAPSHYLRSKADAEATVRNAPQALSTTIFRPSVIFGRGDSLTNRFALLLYMSRGFLPLARAKARFTPIHVGDVAEAFVRALTDRNSRGQTYDLCGPDVMTLRELVQATARTAGLPCHIIPLPDFIARLQALVMDFVPGKPFSTDNYKSLKIDSVCRDNGCARLGITPTSMAALIPSYLGAETRQALLATYRKDPSRLG
jgi:NADH dehydrogenase